MAATATAAAAAAAAAAATAAFWLRSESWLAICTNNYRNYLSPGCELNWNLNCIWLGRRDSVLSTHIFNTAAWELVTHTHRFTHIRRYNWNIFYVYFVYCSCIYRTQKSDITREWRALTFVRSLKLAQCKLMGKNKNNVLWQNSSQVEPA